MLSIYRALDWRRRLLQNCLVHMKKIKTQRGCVASLRSRSRTSSTAPSSALRPLPQPPPSDLTCHLHGCSLGPSPAPLDGQPLRCPPARDPPLQGVYARGPTQATSVTANVKTIPGAQHLQMMLRGGGDEQAKSVQKRRTTFGSTRPMAPLMATCRDA